MAHDCELFCCCKAQGHLKIEYIDEDGHVILALLCPLKENSDIFWSIDIRYSVLYIEKEVPKVLILPELCAF